VSARLRAARAWPELERGAIQLLAVPLGATAQHLAHLPLDTDTRVATALGSSAWC
jgi:creatinine amidohydrolase/Fe(II)-dependent formamide hydrolase-like protein